MGHWYMTCINHLTKPKTFLFFSREVNMWQFKKMALYDTAFSSTVLLFFSPFFLFFLSMCIKWVCIMCQIVTGTKIIFVPKKGESDFCFSLCSDWNFQITRIKMSSISTTFQVQLHLEMVLFIIFWKLKNSTIFSSFLSKRMEVPLVVMCCG